MAISTNLSNISNVQLNTRALAQLNKSVQAGRLSSGKAINSVESGTQLTTQVGKSGLGSGDFVNLRANVISSDKLASIRDAQSQQSFSQMQRFRDLIGEDKPIYGARCNLIMAKDGVQGLAEAQRGATSTMNTAMLNQASGLNSGGKGVLQTSGLQETIQLNDTMTEVNKGKRGNFAQVQANQEMQAFQTGSVAGNLSVLATRYTQLMQVNLSAGSAAVRMVGGERGN